MRSVERGRRRGAVVLHPSDELYGADRVALEVVDVLAESGPVEVWLPDDVAYPGRPLSARLRASGIGVSVLPLPVLRRAYLRPHAFPTLVARTWRTWRALGRRRPALVYVNTSALLPVAPLARLRGADVVAHVHEYWDGPERWVLGLLLRCCRRVLAVSDAVVSRLPVADRRVAVVHNGLDVDVRGDGADARAALRDSIGAGGRDIVVVVASRWNLWKGHETLLRAWDGLERRDAHLVVLGGPPTAGAGVDVPAVVAGMARPESVHVVGEVGETAAWFAAADLVALPSTAPDPFPLVAIEAMAAGTAVFAAAHGGLVDEVDDSVTGRLLPPGDPAAWRAALEAVTPDELARFGAAGRQRYEAFFTRAAFEARLRAALETGARA